MVHPEANAILPELLAGLKETLREDLIGVYLNGSLVTGDFTPGVSDLDLLAATRQTIVPEALDRLRAMHAGLVAAHPEWTGRIEVAYVPHAALQTFKTARSRIGIISPGEPLHGPPPAEIIAPVTTEEFVQAIREFTCAWPHWADRLGDLKSQSYAILTMCRTLVTHRTGEHVSKQRAAGWASRQFPERADLIGQALAWRQGVEDIDPAAALPGTVAFVEMIRGQVCREAGRPVASSLR